MNENEPTKLPNSALEHFQTYLAYKVKNATRTPGNVLTIFLTTLVAVVVLKVVSLVIAVIFWPVFVISLFLSVIFGIITLAKKNEWNSNPTNLRY